MDNKSMTATLKYATSSEKKISLIARMIQGKSVPEAVLFLQYLPKRAAKILLKLVKSASANAKNNLEADPASLKVARVDVGRGPKIKRVRPVGRSRMHGYENKRAFVRVILDTK